MQSTVIYSSHGTAYMGPFGSSRQGFMLQLIE